MTEDGPAPWLGPEFGLVECQEPGYPARTRANVIAADLSLLIGDDRSPGSQLLISIEHEIQAATWQSESDYRRPPPFLVKPIFDRALAGAKLCGVRALCIHPRQFWRRTAHGQWAFGARTVDVLAASQPEPG